MVRKSSMGLLKFRRKVEGMGSPYHDLRHEEVLGEKGR
jgi:hypothetical protein